MKVTTHDFVKTVLMDRILFVSKNTFMSFAVLQEKPNPDQHSIWYYNPTCQYFAKKKFYVQLDADFVT